VGVYEAIRVDVPGNRKKFARSFPMMRGLVFGKIQRESFTACCCQPHLRGWQREAPGLRRAGDETRPELRLQFGDNVLRQGLFH